MFRGDWKTVLLERRDVRLDGLARVRDSLFAGPALADTARQARALCDPESVLARIDDHLAHLNLRWQHALAFSRRKMGHGCVCPSCGSPPGDGVMRHFGVGGRESAKMSR
jgi:hypothetical protein